MVWFHITATFVMRFVPLRAAYALARLLTPYVLLLTPGYFGRAAENMRQILSPDAPASESRRLAKAAFVNYARYMIDLVRLPREGRSYFLERVSVLGWEHVHRAYDQGSGVVFVTGHIGNWDVAGGAFAARGRRVNALVETLSPPAWNARVQRIRDGLGVSTIPIESGVREMLGALRRHEALAILVDRPVPDGIRVSFFGRETRVPGGAATLALRTGSPVVPAVVLRDPGNGGWVARIGEPFLTRGHGSTPADVQALTQRIMSWLEDIIREYPDQWYMFRNMWPHFDDGATRLSSETPAPSPV